MNINDDIVLTLSINEASDLYDALFHCLRISADKNCEKDVSDSLESVFNKLKEASKGHFFVQNTEYATK